MRCKAKAPCEPVRTTRISREIGATTKGCGTLFEGYWKHIKSAHFPSGVHVRENSMLLSLLFAREFIFRCRKKALKERYNTALMRYILSTCHFQNVRYRTYSCRIAYSAICILSEIQVSMNMLQTGILNAVRGDTPGLETLLINRKNESRTLICAIS